MLTDLIVNLLTLRRILVPVPEERHQPFSTRWNPQVWYVSGDFDHPLRGGLGGQQAVHLIPRPRDLIPVAQPGDLLRSIPPVPQRPAQRGQHTQKQPPPCLVGLLAREPGVDDHVIEQGCWSRN